MLKPVDMTRLPEHVRAAVYGALISMGARDGKIDALELACIQSFLRTATLSDGLKKTVLGYLEQPPRLRDCLDGLSATDEDVRILVFQQLYEVAQADGRVQADELNALDFAQAKLGLSDHHRALVEDLFEATRSGQSQEGAGASAEEGWFENLSKARKVAMAAGFAGILVAILAPLIALILLGGMTGGAILATLASIGALVGGGAVAGVGVLMTGGVVGGAAAAALTALLAEEKFDDPDARRLTERVRDLNKLFETARTVAEKHRGALTKLNREYGELLKENFKNERRMAVLEHPVEELLKILREMMAASRAAEEEEDVSAAAAGGGR